MRLTSKFSLGLATLAVAALPFANFAQAAATDLRALPAPTKQAGFCAKLSDSTAAKVTKALSDHEKERTDKVAEIKKKLKDDRAAEDAKIKAERDQAQAKLDQGLKELDAEATSTPEKQVLAEFKTAIKTAMTARKSAVDKANKDFRAGIDQLFTQRQNAVKTAATAFKTSVQTAVNKAKTDCEAGEGPTVVRQTLMDSIKAASEQYRTDLKAVDKLGQQIQALAKTRNDAVKQANQTFKAALEQARAKLKAAMPDGGGSATSTPVSTTTPEND